MKTTVLCCHLIHYDLPHWEMLPLLGTEEMVPCWVFLCMLDRRRISIWGTLWHFSSPDNHIENLHDISECFTFSRLIPRLMSPTLCYKHTHTQTHTHTHTHRHTHSDHRDTDMHTDKQIHRHRDTQRHRHTGTQRHTDTQTYKQTFTNKDARLKSNSK